MSGFIPSELGLLTKLASLCVQPANRTSCGLLLHVGPTLFSRCTCEGFKSN